MLTVGIPNETSGADYQSTDVLPPPAWIALVGDFAYKQCGATLEYQSMVAEANDRGRTFVEIVEDYILPIYNIESIEQFEELYGPVSQ